MNEILRIHNLSKAFGRNNVLQNFNLTLEKGKVYGLMGKNGEGKTTLIRIIMGIIPSDSGEMFYKGQKIKFNNSSYKKEIGYIPEEAFFFRWMRISELLAFNSAFYPAWNAKKAEDYLEKFSLPGAAKIGQLSRGMKLKLGLAVALAAKPELLILDDPTSGIDVPTRQDFLKDIIAELSDGGTTVFFSTHLVHELERIVERFGILEGGNLILDEDYQTVKSQTQKIRLTFEGPVPEDWGFDGILQEKLSPNRCELTVYPWDEDKEKRLRALGPISLEKEALALEEIFMSFISAGGPNKKRNRGRN
jgi:ABC-type multidrug transport system ATPase subunit